eukprot:SM000102S09223  [mRNA]  locus=s102:289851:292720:- [translate_table: standard]
MARRMRELPREARERLRASLRDMLAGVERRDEFAQLQRALASRADVTAEALAGASHTQLEILVAIRTGIQVFLHPDMPIDTEALIEIFLHKRCRNVACQTQLPAEGCQCMVCTTKSGFCHLCMCVVCCKFDFDSNTCRWIGCDFCLHWCHTDCAMKTQTICVGPSLNAGKGNGDVVEMQFHCTPCRRTSELFGFVKDVFSTCASSWDKDTLLKELDFVRRIFAGSQDARGKSLFRLADDLLMERGWDHGEACKEMARFFDEAEYIMDEQDEGLKSEPGGGTAAVGASPSWEQHLCSLEGDKQTGNWLVRAVFKMETDTKEKNGDLLKARAALEAYECELEEKRKEAAYLQYQRQQKKTQIQELETIARFKQAEAEMLQLLIEGKGALELLLSERSHGKKLTRAQMADSPTYLYVRPIASGWPQLRATEAKREADGVQRIAQSKAKVVEEEYASSYLLLRLDEAEAKRKLLSEAVHQMEKAKTQSDADKQKMLARINELLNQQDARPSASDEPR